MFLNGAKFSNSPVLRSTRYTEVEATSWIHSLPSTWEDCGATKACCELSRLNSAATGNIVNDLVFLSNFAAPAWYISEIQ